MSYNEPHRYYHNSDHVTHMLSVLDRRFKPQLSILEYQQLTDAVIYHDIVWQPFATDNEEQSVLKFREENDSLVRQHSPEYLDAVEGLIMATKAPFNPKTELEKLMVYIDWSHFAASEVKLHEVNMNIMKEFQKVPFAEYRTKRTAFFDMAVDVPQKLVGHYVTYEDAEALEDGINTSKMLSEAYRPKIGIYLGSFDPIHKGHRHIIEKAETMLDKVIVVQASSSAKRDNQVPLPKDITDYKQTLTAIDMSVESIVKQLVDDYADYYIIRGIRNNADLTAEQNYMRILKDMGVDVPVIHILCDAEYQHISSSVVRQLQAVGRSDLYV